MKLKAITLVWMIAVSNAAFAQDKPVLKTRVRSC
jgi:hypothetical protein